MTQTVSRLYGTSTHARRAAEELNRRRYVDVHVFTAPDHHPAGDGAEGAAPVQGASQAQLLDAMMKAYIYKPVAQVYAARVAQGASLVTVHAPFGMAQRAIDILEDHDPIDDGIPAPAPGRSYAYDERTPFSSSLCLPVLAETKLPMEAVIGLSSVTGGRWLFSSALMPMLSRSAAPFSRMFGLATASRNATPFSSSFKIPLLSKRFFSSRFGLPLLSRK